MRQQSNAPCLHAAASSSTAEDTSRDVASADRNPLTFWLEKARHAANEQARDNQTDENEERMELDSPNHLRSLEEQDTEMVL